MYNTEVPHQTSAEVLSQVSSYFTAVDNAIAMGDTNKRYQPATNTCYGPPVPVQANSYTTVVISPTADNTADIYNGYIYAEMKCKFTLKADSTKGTEFKSNDYIDKNPYALWVGFKDAMDAIEKYEILANGITIYTQNQAIEESFVTACGLPDSAKRCDPYSRVRHKDVFNRKWESGASCGALIAWDKVNSGTSWTSGDQTIKLKIDLRRFLPLSNIKYLPAFAGKIELRLYFSTAGMVCTPVMPEWKLPYAQYIHNLSDITAEFVPLGEHFDMFSQYTAPTTASIDAVNGEGQPVTATSIIATPGSLAVNTFSLHADKDYSLQICETVIHCFGLASERYDALVQKYMQTPLTFPTQTLAFTQMSNLLNQSNGKTVQTVTPRFVDSIFLLFPLKPTYRTCYKNPSFKTIQLQCGGYGSIPDIAFGTQKSARLLESVQNALNVNCDTVGLNKDILRSLQADSSDFHKAVVSKDSTNFIVGFATETDGTFQQGQTSNTPITYTLCVDQDASSHYAKKVTTTPIMGMLIDSTFSIQIRSDGAPPVVEVGAFDITSPVMM